MRVYVNGQETEIGEGMTPADILQERGLDPSVVVVEHNMTIVPKDRLSESVLGAEDRLELIAFVGGG
ncbi:MAG TPA: sulfur carrier protein ThiS [Armatimonadota bacterium]